MLKPQRRIRKCRGAVCGSSRATATQILLFSILTLVLTAAVVWGGRIWLRNSETLVFAVGEANGPEARFAARLAAVLKNNSSRLRLKIVPNGDNAKALVAVRPQGSQSGDTAHRRQDSAPRPRGRHPRTRRAAAAQPRRQEDQDHRGAEEKEDRRHRRQREQRRAGPQYSRTLGHAGRGGAGPDGAAGRDLRQAVRLGLRRRDRGRARLADREGQELRAKCQARRLHAERDRCGESDRQEDTRPFRRRRWRPACCPPRPPSPRKTSTRSGCNGCWSPSPSCRPRPSSDLARIIYENKAELALADGFASKIEPAATDKDAFIVAHPGAAEYINDEIKSFMERYSDLMYVALRRAQHHRLDLCRASTPR